MRFFTKNVGPETVMYSYYVTFLRRFAFWLSNHADDIVSRHWEG